MLYRSSKTGYKEKQIWICYKRESEETDDDDDDDDDDDYDDDDDDDDDEGFYLKAYFSMKTD